MVKTDDKIVASAAHPLPDYAREGAAVQHDSTPIKEAVASAIERLRRDLDSYHPSKHAIAFALAGETHKTTHHQWCQHAPEAQIALWLALQEAATGLLQQLQSRSARMVPDNGFMYGLQDEVLKLEVQAEITLEEIHRIEDELRALDVGETLQ
jgi:alanine-alpha-ketoisovalerate/valine-pyruvate aminotransferase